MQQNSGFRHRTDDTPILAGRAGTYHETQAIRPLREHFQCVWANRIHHDHVGRIAVVPDGCVDLVWSDHRIIVAGPDLSRTLGKLGGDGLAKWTRQTEAAYAQKLAPRQAVAEACTRTMQMKHHGFLRREDQAR